jgi:hypothetical protein
MKNQALLIIFNLAVTLAAPTVETAAVDVSPYVSKAPVSQALDKRDTYWMKLYKDANFAGQSVEFDNLNTGTCCE